MLGAIAGDIVGSRFEGGPPPPPGFALFHPDCRFTDDTVCTLAVAEALMSGRDFASELRAFVRRHPGRGYGGMFRAWALSDAAPAYGSWGNGAPMRVAAVGWLAADEAEVAALAAAQAQVSHDHPDAVAGAQAVALAILLFRRGAPPAEVGRRIAADFGYDLDPAAALAGGGFDISAAGTVPPALAAALGAADWEGAVRTAVGLGGDADTLACIAGAVAEAAHGLPETVAEAAHRHLTTDLQAVLTRFAAETRRA
ncbi:MAG TPA: ADP-ribosylglycohydrolase family protein [Thermohalobaculum sp.]|nr:ADP-ribosylglycohydrolase family protein [Thermohalobaculum sp.]